MQDVALIGIHTDPDKAEAEINALVTVHDRIKSKWRIGAVNIGESWAVKIKSESTT